MDDRRPCDCDCFRCRIAKGSGERLGLSPMVGDDGFSFNVVMISSSSPDGMTLQSDPEPVDPASSLVSKTISSSEHGFEQASGSNPEASSLSEGTFIPLNGTEKRLVVVGDEWIDSSTK
jgi:hypothetical protein